MNTEEEIASSMCVMLVPSREYTKHREGVGEIHLTLAYFGHFGPSAHQPAKLRQGIHQIAKYIGGPVKAVANATGIFPDRAPRFAVVDLIDGIDTFYARKALESVYGRGSGAYDTLDTRIDYTHGFTPHITREYATAEQMTAAPELLIPREPIEFTFDAIGVWHGHNHYEVAL